MYVGSPFFVTCPMCLIGGHMRFPICLKHVCFLKVETIRCVLYMSGLSGVFDAYLNLLGASRILKLVNLK